MAKVVIEAGQSWDGTYNLDASYLTNRELHWLKREANVRAGELEDALLAGDNDVAVVLAFIALQRAGRTEIPIDALWDLEAGKITLDFSEEEEAQSKDPPENSPANAESVSGQNESSSASSNGAGEVSPERTLPSSTGVRG